MRELRDHQHGRRRAHEAAAGRVAAGAADDADELLLNALFQAASATGPHGEPDESLLGAADAAAARGGFHHEAIIENDGDCLELLIGFVVGFAIGILDALCLLERNGLASVRFKAGIFLGMTWCVRARWRFPLPPRAAAASSTELPRGAFPRAGRPPRAQLTQRVRLHPARSVAHLDSYLLLIFFRFLASLVDLEL